MPSRRTCRTRCRPSSPAHGAPWATRRPCSSRRPAISSLSPRTTWTRSAGGRLVEEDHRRPPDQGRGQVQPPPHATRIVFRLLARGLGQVEPREQFRGARTGGFLREVEQLADHDQVLRPGEVIVDRGELPGQADALAHLVGLLAHVEPVDPGRPRVRAQERSQDAHRRGLARAVRPEDPEHGARAHREINSCQCLRLAKGLHEPRGLTTAPPGLERDMPAICAGS